MEALCHRCLQSMPADSTFCPHCGAPQLYVSSEQAEIGAIDLGATAAVRVPTIDWKLALRVILMVSVAGAVLKAGSIALPVLGVADMLWVLTAASTTLWYYLKRSPEKPMNGRIGARIGLVLGLCLSVLTTLALAGGLTLKRYGFHQGAAMDAEFTAAYGQLDTIYKNYGFNFHDMVTQVLNSPSMRAGQTVGGAVIRAFLIIVFVTVTGAMSGFARAASRRRVSPRS